MAKPTDKGNGGKTGGKGKPGSNNDGTITGDAGANELYGTDGDDVILGLGGDDQIVAGSGNDMLDGGSGSDTYIVNGFEGLDTYADSGSGTAALSAEDGTGDYDVIEAGSNYTTIYMNQFDASSGIEEISNGGYFQVTIGGTGYGDTLDFSNTTLTGITSISTFQGDDNVIGSQGDDAIFGGGGSDTLDGQAGNDTLSGSLGDDNLTGGEGADLLSGGDGSDTFFFNSFADAGDIITDFESGIDQLDLSQLLASEEGSSWSARQEDTDTVISVTDGSNSAIDLVTLNNVDVEVWTQGDNLVF